MLYALKTPWHVFEC